MHLFYTPDIEGNIYTLNAEESKHCVRVLRLVQGGRVALVDGKGGLYYCEIMDAETRGCRVAVVEKKEEYGKRPFHLHVAVAPTKNLDRIEWMLEKCTEMGIDEITLLNTIHSERRNVKEERLGKVIIAAMKQSLKAYLPRLNPMIDLTSFLMKCDDKSLKFIAHCNEGDKMRLDEIYLPGSDAIILIGPEGDFSEKEVACAQKKDFKSITLGESRLRTETAGIVACHSINFMNKI